MTDADHYVFAGRTLNSAVWASNVDVPPGGEARGASVPGEVEQGETGQYTL